MRELPPCGTLKKLTAKTAGTAPVLTALMAWGDRHLVDGPPPVEPEHVGCGGKVSLVPVCEHGHVLTDVNRDSQGRCWCCTRAHERAFAVSEPDVSHGSSSGSLGRIPLRSLLTQ